jgi:hypothetical protein
MHSRVYGALALSLAALALVVVVSDGGQRAYAANFTVDTVADNAALTACTPSPGDCSLRGAIIAANGNVPGPPDTITLPAGTYTLSIAGTDISTNPNPATGDLDFTSGFVTLNGAGAASTIIDGAGIDRVLDVKPNTNSVTISGLTIRNGYSAPAAGSSGGGFTAGTGSPSRSTTRCSRTTWPRRAAEPSITPVLSR